MSSSNTMKIIVNPSYHIPPDYPHLRQSLEYSELIILFVNKTSGLIINGGNKYSRGEYKTKLEKNKYIYFKGTITLTQ